MQMLIIVPSGSRYCHSGECGIFFWGAHEHDSVWHLAVSNTLLSHHPFEMPNMSGTTISGYNYLLDISIAILQEISRIPSSIWFFKILPIFWFLVLIKLSHKFAISYRKSSTYSLSLWFFMFFGSSFSYLLSLHNKGSIWGSSSLLSMQSLQNMLNPQFAYSLIPLIILLIGINESKKSYKDYFKYAIYIAIAIALKFYTGAIMLVMIGFDLLIGLINERRKWVEQIAKGILVVTITLLSIWIFYAPGKTGGSPLVFSPLTTVNPLIEDQSLLYLSVWAQRLYEYQGVRLLLLEMAVFIAFIVLNFGSRILGLFALAYGDKKTNSYTKKIIIIGAIAGLLMATFFVQRGVWWNTVQFLYVSLFLTSILAAEGLDILMQSKKALSILFVAVIIILTIPSNIDIVRSFARFPGNSYIPDTELQALAVLRALPNGVVLHNEFRPRVSKSSIPVLGRTYDAAYISAYSLKQTYLSDVIQLELTNIDYKERLIRLQSSDCRVLDQVDYIYEYMDDQFVNTFSTCGKRLDRVFENEAVSVYTVN